MSSGRVESQMYAEEPRTGPSGARSQFPSTMPLQLSEQHKSKLLPGSKSLEMESTENNKRQGYQQAIDTGGIEVAWESSRNSNPQKPITTDSKTDSQPVDRLVERPRLNLKPRSQLLDQTDGSLERERSTLFGGARPREVVLKERGVDDITINNLDVSHLPDRVNSPKKEVTSEHFMANSRHDQKVANSRHGQKVENQASHRRTGANSEDKDKHMDQDNVNAERRNWPNENWRSSRDVKGQQHEPETWRKPIEEPTHAFCDASGIRHGKLVSALELAQAFSKSVSRPKIPIYILLREACLAIKIECPFHC